MLKASGDFMKAKDGLVLLQFDSTPLIAFTATKVTDYRTGTDMRVSPKCGTGSTDLELTRKQVSDDLCFGVSTLNMWGKEHLGRQKCTALKGAIID
ncbi:hypothetical protein [Pacificibacter sp. AS14]|uniref:hypothetical protein n=1 Tax=Pacificibacter sp. AS14 TaxID=3135785 RepID=UPI00317F08EF